MDKKALRREIGAKKRALSAAALYYQPLDAAEPWGSEDLVKTVGGYGFYSSSGRI